MSFMSRLCGFSSRFALTSIDFSSSRYSASLSQSSSEAKSTKVRSVTTGSEFFITPSPCSDECFSRRYSASCSGLTSPTTSASSSPRVDSTTSFSHFFISPSYSTRPR